MKRLTGILLCVAALASAQFAAKRAPGFCLIDTTGQWRDLADYRGKVVLVEFMQTTCPHCANFTTILSGAAAKYGDKLQILSIALAPDTPQTMMQYVTGHKQSWPLLLDQGQVAQAYVRGPELNFPAVWMVDRDGMIVKSWQYGGLSKDIFEGNGLAREIERLIAPANATPMKKK